MLNKEILKGIRALEWAEGVAAPYCGRLLADLGAEVIKIESPEGGGDPARCRGPFAGDKDHSQEGGLFLLMNVNKQGITLDPLSPAGQDLFKRLVQKANVLILDRLTGEMEQRGIGPKVLLDLRPSLVITALTPFGQTGPYSEYKAYPLNTFHAGGSGYILPFEDESPERPPIRVWRHAGEIESGITAAVATLAALFYAMVTGEGQFVDVSKQEALMNLERMDLGRYPNDGEFLSRTRKPYRIGGRFRCRDGYVTIIPVQEPQWQGLARLLGNPEWTRGEMCRDEFARAEHSVEIQRYISEALLGMDKEELYHRGQSFGVPITPIYNVSELLNSPQLQSRGFFVPVDPPVHGPIALPSLPYVFDGKGFDRFHPAPSMGQDNERVFGDLLGLFSEELEALREAGVIR